MKSKLIVIGNFGENGGNCGQTIKTNVIHRLLKNEYKEDILKFNTNKLSNPFQVLNLINMIFRGDRFIILPAQRMLTILAFLFYFLNKKADYIVIGGWLPEFLDGSNYITKKVVRDNFRLFVETNNMKEKLDARGYLSRVLPNFKDFVKFDLNFITKSRSYDFECVKFAFVSRVIKEKGVLDAIHSIDKVATNHPSKNFELDIYGGVPEKFEKDFKLALNGIKSENLLVNYRGFVEPSNIQNTLILYTFFIFPTYYSGEGFPGCIIDSLSAGLPIIASDWRYNNELVKNGVNGYLHEARNLNSLINTLELVIGLSTKDYEVLIHNCLTESINYHEDVIKLKMKEFSLI